MMLLINRKKNDIAKCKDAVLTLGVKSMVSDRVKWLLVIVQEADHVEGLTRLHKYAFLMAHRIRGIINAGFYQHWMPSKFGPFCPELAHDVNEAIQTNLLQQTTKVNSYGYKVGVLIPTAESQIITKELRTRYPKYIKEIQKYIKLYQNRKLIDMLHDVYALYPEYITKSTIKAEVGRNIYESDSFLNPEYD